MKELKRLLKNIELNDFFKTYWGNKVLHIKGREGDYSDFLSWNKFNNIIKYRDLSPHLKFFYENTPILPHSISHNNRSRNGTPIINMDDALKFAENGATTVIQQIQIIDESLSNLAHNLSIEFAEPININAYYSSKNVPGFDFHTDCHETIVIQIEGKKQWELLNEDSSLPIRSQFIKDNKQIDIASKETLMMEKGDFLYVPRGIWHRAVAQEPSLHLTISITCKYKYEVINELSKLLLSKKYYRKNLHSDYPNTNEIDEKNVTEVINDLQETLSAPDILEELKIRLIKSNELNKDKRNFFNFPYEI